jgi:hypothetical protein
VQLRQQPPLGAQQNSLVLLLLLLLLAGPLLLCLEQGHLHGAAACIPWHVDEGSSCCWLLAAGSVKAVAAAAATTNTVEAGAWDIKAAVGGPASRRQPVAHA